MKRVVEFLIKNNCPGDVVDGWMKLENHPCSFPDNQICHCRECWANVEKHLESEAEKKNEKE